MEKILLIHFIASTIISTAVVLLAGISKLTKTKRDDRLLAWLRPVEDALRVVSLDRARGVAKAGVANGVEEKDEGVDNGRGGDDEESAPPRGGAGGL